MSNLNRARLALLILFVAIAYLMRFNTIVGIESDILLDLHSHSTDSIDHTMLAVNAIGGPKPVLVAALLLAFIVFRKGDKREAVIIPFAVGISGALNVGMRALFHWPRPDLWRTLIYDHSFVYSFPGGHACLSASLATVVNMVLWRTRYRRLAVIGGIVYCLVVATTTLFLGVHYPMDILAGWISGFLVVSILWSGGEAISARFGNRDTSRRLNQVQADEQGS